MATNDKLDARSRWQLRQHKYPGKVEVLLRLEDKPSGAQLTQLQQLGSKVRSVQGTVLTASVEVDQLTELAKFPFVASIQLSQKLYQEER